MARNEPMHSPRYSRRHYEDVAQLIAEARRVHASADSIPWNPEKALGAGEALSDLVNLFAQRFTADNARFDRALFETACLPKGTKVFGVR